MYKRQVEGHLRAVVAELRAQLAADGGDRGDRGGPGGDDDGRRAAPRGDDEVAKLAKRLEEKEQALRYVENELLGLGEIYDRKERKLAADHDNDTAALRRSLDEAHAARDRHRADLGQAHDRIRALMARLEARDAPPPPTGGHDRVAAPPPPPPPLVQPY